MKCLVPLTAIAGNAGRRRRDGGCAGIGPNYGSKTDRDEARRTQLRGEISAGAKPQGRKTSERQSVFLCIQCRPLDVYRKFTAWASRSPAQLSPSPTDDALVIAASVMLSPPRRGFGRRLLEGRSVYRPTSDQSRPRRGSCRASSTICTAESGGNPLASPPNSPDGRAA
jgi:hypothetical protein